MQNRLIAEEVSYNVKEMKVEHDKLYSNLNVEQQRVYDSVINNVNSKKGGIFFVHRSGGCGKTFLWKTLIFHLRSEKKIVLHVASSGIAAVLLPGGRTTHSRFLIPLDSDEYTIAGICHGTDIAELLQYTSLIIWDEAPMQNRYAFESIDRCFRDIMSAIDSSNCYKPFGGITMVFGGDFRQILHVVPKGTRADIVNIAFNRSKLWIFCELHILKQNMRLHAGNSEAENKEIEKFSNWVLDIGNGKLPNLNSDSPECDADIEIPEEFLVHADTDPIDEIIKVTYPNLLENFRSSQYLKEKAILTPTNVVVDDINTRVLDKLPGKTYTYISTDVIIDPPSGDDDVEASIPVEYLNSLNMSGIPKHNLVLKEGSVVMLLRNLSQINGLSNGTRMIVKKCNKNTVECQILCGGHVGTTHLIPRIYMVPSDKKWPVQFTRRQLPLQICFAMTINKSQGQSLETVGLYLPTSIFTHGQLYVVVSRVTSNKGLHILICSERGGTTNITKNIVYEEVLYNLQYVNVLIG
ncbi:uncharacterized protein LOC141692081 [Apium graveolens]|uniref:uncharacterized protein LOC141692081 n=1 Tax=Apium graveolens TaxID=4045 RepID=UPI003D7A2FB9